MQMKMQTSKSKRNPTKKLKNPTSKLQAASSSETELDGNGITTHPNPTINLGYGLR